MFTYIKTTWLWQNPRKDQINSWIIQEYIPQIHHADDESLEFRKKGTPKGHDKLSNVLSLPHTTQTNLLQKHLCVFLGVSVKRSNHNDTYYKFNLRLQISISDSWSWIKITNEK